MNEFIQILIGGVLQGSIFALLALGFSLVYRVTGVINLAQGGFCTLGALLAYTLEVELGWPVLAAACADPPGPRLTRLFETLGAASYPLYALHKPLGEIVTMALHQRAPQVMQHWAVLAGAPYLLAVLGVCILVERYYDRPARQALKMALGRSWSLAGRTARAAFGPAIAAIAK